ncbi:hypothetical protein GQ457_01G015220 [Hibiscus cannabinus]
MFQIWITMSFSVSAEIAPSKDGCCGEKTTGFAKATLLNSRDQIVSAPLILRPYGGCTREDDGHSMKEGVDGWDRARGMALVAVAGASWARGSGKDMSGEPPGWRVTGNRAIQRLRYGCCKTKRRVVLI